MAIHVTGFADLTGTRLAGVIWLDVGLLLLWMACRIALIDPVRCGAAALLIATAPLVIYSGSYVTNDAASILAGSLVLFAAALAWKNPGRSSTVLLLCTGLFVASIKLTNALPVAAISILFAILLMKDRADDQGGLKSIPKIVRSWLPNGGALLIGGLISVVAWAAIERKLSIINPKQLPTLNVLRQGQLGLTTILRESVSMWTPLTGSYDAFRSNASAIVPESSESQNIQLVTATVLAYLVVAGSLSGMFVRIRKWYHWLGFTSFATLYLGGLVLGISIWASYNADPGISGRYGLAMVPLIIVSLVAAARGRFVVLGLWAWGLLSFGLSIYFMLSG
jgi:hypothetical protein